ncbi:MAG: hypothetical protein V1696_01465 [Candidatus Jorgensenbacteria bacterium]
MKEKYDPSKIEHLESQEGLVEDSEKARRMANTEEWYKEWSDDYDKYLKDHEGENPAEHLNWLEKLTKSPGTEDKDDAQRALAFLGIKPEYIEKIGEVDAEAIGEKVDYEKTLRSKSESELRADSFKLFATQIFWNAWGVGRPAPESKRIKQDKDNRFSYWDAEGEAQAHFFQESPRVYSKLAHEWAAMYKRGAISDELERRRREKERSKEKE